MWSFGRESFSANKDAVEKLIAARLAADVSNTPTILVARTDADAADLVTSDVDETDRPFLTGERTSEGFYRLSLIHI